MVRFGGFISNEPIDPETFNPRMGRVTQMRFPLPDLGAPIQVTSAATGLINTFAADLFEYINTGLSRDLGNNWLDLMQLQNLGTELNFKDPAVLLKELVHKGQSPLRRPISALVPKANWKAFYNRLEDLLGERNQWVHNSVKPDSDSLKSLVLLVNKISFYLELPVTKECDALLEHISPQGLDPDLAEKATNQDGLKPSSADIAVGEIGTPVSGPFVSHSYTLHLDGSIRDRGSDKLLQELLPESQALGALLISRKPNGGRLKVTTQGQIAAYFGDYWGLLGEVEPKSWFPGHLS